MVFGDSFVRLVMSRGTNGGEPAIALALHREMCFSRVSKQDEQSRRIAYHGYSAKWSEMPSPDDVIVTPLLERANPLYDLLVRLGKEIDPESGRVTALIIPGRLRWLGLLGREEERVIPWEHIRRLGEDIIFVRI